MRTLQRNFWAGIVASLFVFSTTTLLADTFMWTGMSNMSWPNASNWSPSTGFPNAADAVAIFPSTASRFTVDVDASITVGQIMITSSTSYLIEPGEGGSLTFASNNIPSTAELDSSGANHTISAPITLSSNIKVDVAANTTLFLSGGISGPGGLTKSDRGTAFASQLAAVGANYQGPTLVNGGVLEIVNALLPGSITVDPTLDPFSTFRGTGRVGTVTVGPPGMPGGGGPGAQSVGIEERDAGGDLFPGASPGILHTLDVTMKAGSNLEIEIDGPGSPPSPMPGTDYSQLDVMGMVQLADTNGQSKLDVMLGPSYVHVPGTMFRIINNDGTDPVSGTFAGLPEDAIFSVNGFLFQIDYDGGDGNNDVVLKALGPGAVPEPGSLALWGVGLLGLLGWRRWCCRTA